MPGGWAKMEPADRGNEHVLGPANPSHCGVRGNRIRRRTQRPHDSRHRASNGWCCVFIVPAKTRKNPREAGCSEFRKKCTVIRLRRMVALWRGRPSNAAARKVVGSGTATSETLSIAARKAVPDPRPPVTSASPDIRPVGPVGGRT